MNNSKSVILVVLCVLMLGGCSSVVSCDDGRDARWFSSPTDHVLNNGIKSYEDGDYAASMTILQSLLNNQAASTAEKVRAYKYMAFIHCVSSQDRLCRESFRKAFELDPNFNLSPAEAGHPVWGPVFSSERNKLSK